MISPRLLQKVKNRFRAKQQRRIRDMEHKISRSVVDYATQAGAGTLAIGDVRNIADAPEMGNKQNQKLSTWRHGKLRAYLTYKAEAEGMRVVLVDERHTSQTCPNCQRRHKPKGRTYRCPDCRFQTHRDVVGAVGYPLGDPQSPYPRRCGEDPPTSSPKVSSPVFDGQA